MLTRFILSLVLILALAQPSFAAEYFSDDCTDGSAINLESHTPSGGSSWTKIDSRGATPNLRVTDTYCHPRGPDSSSGALYTADAASAYPTANYAVQFTIDTWDAASEPSMSLGCRMVAGVDGYVVLVFDDTRNPDVILYRSDDSVTTSLGTANVGPTAGDDISLECDGSSITVKKNGVAVIGPVTDATYSAVGKAALGGGKILDTAFGGMAGGAHRVDDFLVTSIDAGRRPIAPMVFQ